MDRFEKFLLNENKSHLGQKVNDILTSMQDLQGDIENLGSRHFNRLTDEIVNELRKVLHGDWGSNNQQYLSDIQKVAVALKKTLEDKGDIKEVFPAAVQSMQSLAGKLGVQVNDMEAPEMEGDDVTQDDFELTGDPEQQPDPSADPNMQQQPDPMQQMPDPNVQQQQPGQQPPMQPM